MKSHKKIPHKEDTPTTSTSPHVKSFRRIIEESIDSHIEVPYTISQEEVNKFRRIIITYT